MNSNQGGPQTSERMVSLKDLVAEREAASKPSKPPVQQQLMQATQPQGKQPQLLLLQQQLQQQQKIILQQQQLLLQQNQNQSQGAALGTGSSLSRTLTSCRPLSREGKGPRHSERHRPPCNPEGEDLPLRRNRTSPNPNLQRGKVSVGPA